MSPLREARWAAYVLSFPPEKRDARRMFKRIEKPGGISVDPSAREADWHSSYLTLSRSYLSRSLNMYQEDYP